MSKKTVISSKNQQGGVTAHTVNHSAKKDNDGTSSYRKFGLVVGIATIIGLVYTALTYHGG